MTDAAPAEPKPVTALAFMAQLLARKFRRRLSDLDILVMLALANSPAPPRFYQVVTACGCSSTGAWNALERLDDHGLVKTTGKPGAHTYLLTDDGIREIRYLCGK